MILMEERKPSGYSATIFFHLSRIYMVNEMLLLILRRGQNQNTRSKIRTLNKISTLL